MVVMGIILGLTDAIAHAVLNAFLSL